MFPAVLVGLAFFANLILFIDWVESATGFDSGVYLQVSALPASVVAAAPAEQVADEALPASQPAANTAAVAVATLGPDVSSGQVAAAAVDAAETAVVAVDQAETEGLEGKTIWVGGDSMAFYVARGLLAAATAEGAIAVNAGDAVTSSGLNSPGFFDWPAYIAAEIEAHNPDILVFMIGANDAKPGMDLDAYHQRVGALMDATQGRQVIWVGQPSFDPAQRPDLSTSIPAVNEVFFLEALDRPWVTYVDTWTLSTDDARAYARYLPDETGALVEFRAADGIHLTSAGGRRLAAAIMDYLR
jgi:hypothetical protein